MNLEKYKRQYEYECVCGYVWIDSVNNPCPMCKENMQIIVEPYESLPPEKSDRRK